VPLGLLALGEEAGALEDQVDTVGGVGELGRAPHRGDLDLLAVHHDALLGGLHLEREDPVDRVVLEQVGEGLRVGEVVDRDDLEVLLASRDGCAEDAPADTTETIDCDAGHGGTLPLPGYRGVVKWGRKTTRGTGGCQTKTRQDQA
jgi:hypothetical protein